MATEKHINLITDEIIDSSVFRNILSILQLEFDELLDDEGFKISEDENVIDTLDYKNSDACISFRLTFGKTNFSFNKRIMYASYTNYGVCKQILFDLDSFEYEEQETIKNHIFNKINKFEMKMLVISDLDYATTTNHINFINLFKYLREIPNSIEFLSFLNYKVPNITCDGLLRHE